MIRAKIQSLRNGQSERSLIHAVDQDGLEYKIEVPTAALSQVSRARDLTLIMSWVVEETPLPGAKDVEGAFEELMRAPPAAAQASGSTESAALLTELTRAVGAADPLQSLIDTAPTAGAGPTTTQAITAEQQLAKLLGIVPQ